MVNEVETLEEGEKGGGLKTCSHSFLQCNRVHRPLQASYNGLCQLRLRGDKTLTVHLDGREETVSADRLTATAIEPTQSLVPDHPAPFLGPGELSCRRITKM